MKVWLLFLALVLAATHLDSSFSHHPSHSLHYPVLPVVPFSVTCFSLGTGSVEACGVTDVFVLDSLSLVTGLMTGLMGTDYLMILDTLVCVGMMVLEMSGLMFDTDDLRELAVVLALPRSASRVPDLLLILGFLVLRDILPFLGSN